MINIVKKEILDLLLEVIEFPISYFSEKSLQVKLSSRLLKYKEFSEPINTNIYNKFSEEFDKLNPDMALLLKSLSVPPLLMEYGVDKADLPYRMDIAILNPENIQKINNWQFQHGDKKYLQPLIGIEFGTEKSGWSQMSGEHLDNDENKLNMAEHGIIINIMRNFNVSSSDSGRGKAKTDVIDEFGKAMINKSINSKKIKWIGLILHIAYQEVEILEIDNKWHVYKMNEVSKIKIALNDILK